VYENASDVAETFSDVTGFGTGFGVLEGRFQVESENVDWGASSLSDALSHASSSIVSEVLKKLLEGCKAI
jgi:hypothetical protein